MKWLRNCCWLKKWFHRKCLKTGKDSIWRKSNGKEFHNWQADTLKDLPPSDLRLYLGQTKLKLEYLVLRACRSHAIKVKKSSLPFSVTNQNSLDSMKDIFFWEELLFIFYTRHTVYTMDLAHFLKSDQRSSLAINALRACVYAQLF